MRLRSAARFEEAEADDGIAPTPYTSTASTTGSQQSSNNNRQNSSAKSNPSESSNKQKRLGSAKKRKALGSSKKCKSSLGLSPSKKPKASKKFQNDTSTPPSTSSKESEEIPDASILIDDKAFVVGQSALMELPYETLLNIIYQADYATATTLRLTSRIFYNIINDNKKSILVNWSKIHLLDNYQPSFPGLTTSQKIIRAFARSNFADTILNAVILHNANSENRILSCSRTRLQALALYLDEIKHARRNPAALLEGRMPIGRNHVLIFGGMITCTTLLKRRYYTEDPIAESTLRTAVVCHGIEWAAKVLTMGGTGEEHETLTKYTHDAVRALRVSRVFD